VCGLESSAGANSIGQMHSQCGCIHSADAFTVMTAAVQVFGRRNNETIHAFLRPASKNLHKSGSLNNPDLKRYDAPLLSLGADE
jgi:hypothetical protein